MLAEALHARIPLIELRTADPVCVSNVVFHLSGKSARKWPSKGDIPAGSVYVIHNKLAHHEEPESLYLAMVNAGATAIIVNPEHPIAMSYDAGQLVVPPELLLAELTRASVDPSDGVKMVDAIDGLTPLEVRWLIALVQGAGNQITLETLRAARISHSPPVRGLAPVSTEVEFYYAEPKVANWIESSGVFFDHEDTRLRPRGILFDGVPGTGKTLAAKVIARSLKLPLYRLEIGSVKSKYVGQSEKLLADALSTIDRYAPVVLLIDEVEKILTGSGSGDSGTSSALLGQILWWLQEHTSTVLTIMTTNNIEAIPKELYRPGRIDEVMTIEPLKGTTEIKTFIRAAVKHYPTVGNPNEFVTTVWSGLSMDEVATPAECVAAVQKHVKLEILRKEK